MRYLEQSDAEIFNLIRQEEIRQKDKIRLIASENYVSAAVMEATGSVLTNGGTISQLLPEGSNGTAMSVTLTGVGSSAGQHTGTAQVGFVSDGTGTSGLAPLALTAGKNS